MTPRLMQNDLEENARRRPDAIAVLDGSRSISYGELSRLSDNLAKYLKRAGVSRQDRVVFILPRSVHCVTAILGILKADAVYVPLDPKAPKERIARILDECRPAAVICDSSTILHLSGISEKAPVVVPGPLSEFPEEFRSNAFSLEDPADLGTQEPLCRNTETDLAYILYTSGSTGRPKGVQISHLNIRLYIDWAVECFGIDPGDRVLGTAPFHFDMSTFDIFASLRAGATFCIATEPLTLFPAKLVEFMEAQEVTIWKGVSSLLMYMARAGVVRKGRIPSLNRVLFAGESLSTAVLIEWMETFPEKKFFNIYGPTEATGGSLYYRVPGLPNPGERIPIGVPCKAGTRVCLLDEEGRPVPDGEAGELCIAGPSLSRGYFNDPEKTVASFISDPMSREPGERLYRTGDLALRRSDGNIEFIGRRDNQIKYMGYRIESEEIERHLMSVNGVREAAVFLIDSGVGEVQEIAAFLEGEATLDRRNIHGELKNLLPAYMIPKRFIYLEKLPRSDRGKIDRAALRELFANMARNDVQAR